MSLSDRFVIAPSGNIETANKDRIDPVIDAMKAEGKADYPHKPVKRDMDGNIMFNLREDLLNSPSMRFKQTIDSISQQFNALVELLRHIRF